MIRKARSNVRFIYRTKAYSLKLVLKGAIKRKFIPETSANFNRLLETSLSQREIRIFQGIFPQFHYSLLVKTMFLIKSILYGLLLVTSGSKRASHTGTKILIQSGQTANDSSS